MKKAIGILHNPDNITTPLTIYYNGPQECITGENDEIIASCEYKAENETDAREAARCFWGAWPWEYEELE